MMYLLTGSLIVIGILAVLFVIGANLEKRR